MTFNFAVSLILWLILLIGIFTFIFLFRQKQKRDRKRDETPPDMTCLGFISAGDASRIQSAHNLQGIDGVVITVRRVRRHNSDICVLRKEDYDH